MSASNGSGSGTLGLNLNDNDSIADTAGNKLGGTGTGTAGSGGPGNGSFTGQVYTIDRTAPTVTAAAVTLPGSAAYPANTWTNKDVRVTFTCSDTGGSGLTGASGNHVQNFTVETSGTTATFSGTCTDNAGNNAAAASFGPIKIDKTDPTLSVTHTANGVQRVEHELARLALDRRERRPERSGRQPHVHRQRQPASGERQLVTMERECLRASASTTSTARSWTTHGNDQTASDEVRIDTTAPVIVASVSGTARQQRLVRRRRRRDLDAHRIPSRSIATSTGCGPTTVSTDTTGLSVTCSATNGAGLSNSESTTVKRDASDPRDRQPGARPDHNGWYNHGVGYGRRLRRRPAASPARCGALRRPRLRPPRSPSTAPTTPATRARARSPFKYDDTDPSVTVNLARDPDHNGWYNHGVGYRAVGSDATSGIAGCDAGAVYDGPDSETASVSLDCTDNAGNEGSGSKSFKYDDTDPSVTVNLARDPDHNGWYNHGVGYRAVGSDATSGIAGCDAGAVYDGPDSATASVSLDCTDNAGNEGSGSAVVQVRQHRPDPLGDHARPGARSRSATAGTTPGVGWTGRPAPTSAAAGSTPAATRAPCTSGPDSATGLTVSGELHRQRRQRGLGLGRRSSTTTPIPR